MSLLHATSGQYHLVGSLLPSEMYLTNIHGLTITRRRSLERHEKFSGVDCTMPKGYCFRHTIQLGVAR